MLIEIVMTKKFLIIIFISLHFLSLPAQDVLLTLTGKEVPCVINKIDTFFVFYQPLGPLESIEKSLVQEITPRSLLLKDGTQMKVVFDLNAYDVNGPYIFYREPKKLEKMKDRYNYFSCTQNSFETLLPFQDSIKLKSTEKILYAQDSLHRKFELAVEEQQAYTYGRRSARRNFTSPWSTLGGIATGFAGGVILNFFYAAAPALIYTSINASIRPKVGVTDPKDAPYINNEFFIEGYRNQARLLKVQNSILGTVPALAVGIVFRYFGTVK